jgi:hypothetical protein
MHKFIICGASRAGKSTLSERLVKEFGVSWLVGDCLVESLENAFPKTGIQFFGGFETNADLFTKYLIQLLKSYDEEGVGYVLDTVHIRPDNVADIHKALGHIPSVFLGYIDIDPVEKVKMIRDHDPKHPDFWSVKMSDEELIKHTYNHIELSQNNKKGCETDDIPFFDTGVYFKMMQDNAYQSLINQSK